MALPPQADQWFQLLDGRWVTSAGQSWILAVESVYVEGDDVWIQLSRKAQEATILVHVRPPATIHDVVNALQHSITTEHRIEVRRAA